MKQVYIINENHPQLLLFFAGWAADETPFKQYRPKNMDYMICYDYRTLDFDYSIFDRYRQRKPKISGEVLKDACMVMAIPFISQNMENCLAFAQNR